MEAHTVYNVSKFDGFAEVFVIRQPAEEELVMFDITLCVLEGILRLRAIRMLACAHLYNLILHNGMLRKHLLYLSYIQMVR